MTRFTITLLGAFSLMGCGDSDAESPAPAGGSSGGAMLDGTDQTPPTDGAAADAWLATGKYQAWHCEAKEHESRSPSPHSVNRICSNDAISGAGATEAFPAGAAGVKELYTEIGGTIQGYAVYFKTEADSASGNSWYWYEKNEGSVVADGLGVSLCVGCHAGAGPSHAPTSRDFVWTQVQ